MGHQKSFLEKEPPKQLWWYKKEPTEVQSVGRQVDKRERIIIDDVTCKYICFPKNQKFREIFFVFDVLLKNCTIFLSNKKCQYFAKDVPPVLHAGGHFYLFLVRICLFSTLVLTLSVLKSRNCFGK
jgi:hypothetical protein